MSETTEGRPTIVVGVDGSEHSKLALTWAARMAAAESARIEAVMAWEIPPVAYGGYYVDPRTVTDMQDALAETVDGAFPAGRPEGMELRVVRGDAAAVLLDESRAALMLVVGSRGHGGFMGLLLGSVSSKVAEHATCPVLVVHRSATPAVPSS
jgi:nucleotide-binding universal stress UspA family protein